MRWLWQVGALAIMIAGGWLGLGTLDLPPVVPASAPLSQFSADRALSELRPITKAPHAVGSEEHQAVLMLLTDRLRAFGFEVEVQAATGFNRLGGSGRAANVRNIVARRRGTQSTGTLLLMAHYDAVPRSLGAGDDGSGVATLLETMRALHDESLRNDVVVLFTDAEEAGLLGAEAFANLHAFAGDVRMILNFDARGDRGPVYLFQTSAGNAPLLRAAAESHAPILANSLTAAIYRLLPNDTDLSIFLRDSLPIPALNFAMIDGFQNYHSPTDDILHLDPRTLQQMGDAALPLARTFGNADLASLHGSDAVYFNAPLVGMVRYSVRWALPLALIALAGVIVLAMAGRRASLYGLHGGFWGQLAVGMMLVVPTGLGYLGWRIVGMLHPGYQAILHGEPYNALAYFVGFTVLALTLGVAMQQMFVIRLRPLDLVIPAFLMWGVLGVVAAIWMPGATFLLTWPLLAALAGAAWWLDGVRRGTRRPIGAALSAVPAIFLFAPMLRMTEVGLTMSSIPVLIFLMMFVLSLCALPILLVGHTWRWVLPLSLVGGIWAVTAAELNAKFGPEQRRPDSLLYLADDDAGKAWWVSFDGESDDFTRQALGSNPKRASFAEYHLWDGVDSLVSAVAPAKGATAARVEVVSVEGIAGGRRVHLRVTASGNVEFLSLRTDRKGQRITNFVLDGRQLQDADTLASPYLPKYRLGANGLLLSYYGMPSAGIDLQFSVHSIEPFVLITTVGRGGLPSLAAGPLTPRTNGFIAKPFIPTDMSLVVKRTRI